MSKIKSIIAIVILIISWCLMFWITGNRTPWQAFSSTDKGDGVSVFLGDIPSENYDRMGFTKGLIEYIVSKNAWLVGTDRGELFLFDNSGKQIWKRSLGIGKLVSLCVSHDEKITFVGEQSPAGNLYAIDLDGGDILWKFAAEKVVGVNLTNVLIQASYIFVLIKMIMFTQMLIDLLQRKMEGAAIMVKLLLLIKTVSSFGNSQRVKILIVGSIGVMLMIITIKSYYQLLLMKSDLI